MNTLQNQFSGNASVQVMGAPANQTMQDRTIALEEEKDEAIGVKVIHNAPDPRNANVNLGKYKCSKKILSNKNELDLNVIFLAVVPTDEEKKIGGPSVGELQKKKKAAAGKKARNCRDPAAFNTYIFRVLKQVCSEKKQIGISQKAMQTMNSIVADTFDNIMSEGRMLVINGKKSTLSSKDVETAVKLLIPGELGKGSVTEGR